MLLVPYGEPAGRLADIISFHDRKGNSLLRVIQWKGALMIKARDGARTLEKGMTGAFASGQPAMIVITVMNEGMHVYLDGLKKGSLAWSGSLLSAGLDCFSIGNSPEGWNSWDGRLAFLVLLRGKADERVLTGQLTHAVAFERAIMAFYGFDETSGSIARNNASDFMHIMVPPSFRAFKKELLESPFEETLSQKKFDKSDGVLNLLGFLPFGFLVFAVLPERVPLFTRILAAVSAGGALSLSIELAQFWLPDRHSSLSDLVLNTLGTGAGAMAGTPLRRFIYRLKARFCRL